MRLSCSAAMTNSLPSSLLILLISELCHSAILPLAQTITQLQNDALPFDLSNTSSSQLGYPNWVPNAFEVELFVTLDEPRMNSLAFGLNTVEAMYDLCLLNQQAPLGEREWSNPNNNLKIALAGTQTRFALWGLLITAKGVADWGYPQPLLGRFTWKEDASNVGNISIQGPQTSNEMVDNVTSPTSSPSSNITVPDPDDNDLASSKTSSNPPTALTNPTPLETGIGLTISLTYNGASLRNKDVFEILLAAMTVTADHPSSSDFCGIAPGYGLSITSEVNPDGTCRLLYRHVYKLCRVIARWLVAERKFQEMDIVLTKGDVLVAEGRLMAGLPYGSRVQLANTTLLDHITA